jgi:hypothetical protein
MTFEPGWLMRTCHEAHIRSMCNNGRPYLKHYGFDPGPASESDAKELYEMMAARFMAWTGRPISDFVK